MNALQLLLQQQLGPLLSLWHYSASKLSVCDRVCVCVRDCSLVLFWSFPYCNSQRSNLQFSFSTHTNLGLLQKRRRTLLYKWLWLALVSRSSKGALPTAAPDGMPHSCRFIVQGEIVLFEGYLKAICATIQILLKDMHQVTATAVRILLGDGEDGEDDIFKRRWAPCIATSGRISGMPCSCNNTWHRCRSLTQLTQNK